MPASSPFETVCSERVSVAPPARPFCTSQTFVTLRYRYHQPHARSSDFRPLPLPQCARPIPGRGRVPYEQIFGDTNVASDRTRGIFYLGLKGREFRHGKAELHIDGGLLSPLRARRSHDRVAFTYVGIERALCDEVGTEFFCLLFEHFFVYAAHREALFAHRGLALERL